jgi:methyl-accepting chemotaxis protein
MERLVLAYGQIRATGYLRASEVRQLTEAGIPIVEELAKKMSELRGETVSAAEVMGMISERAISFGMVKEVFDDMTSAGGMFYKMQEKQAETLAGQISNLKDSFAIMYDEIGRSENVNSTIKSMIGLVKSLAENWQSIANLIKYTAIQYGVMYGATLFIPKLLRSTELMAKSQDAFARASKMSAAATQRHSAILAFSAKQTRLYAYWMRQAAMAHTMFGRGLKQIMAMLAGGGWIGIAIGFLTAMTSLIISAIKESKRLNNELSKIGTEGAMQAEQSVRNFEYLAKTIRESADGSEKQTKALAELKRSYGDLLPTQDKEIKALVQEKSNYDALIKSIREKINLQIHEQKLNTLASEYGGRLSKQEGKLQETLKDIGLSPSEIGRIFTIVREQVEKGVTLGVEDFAKILTDATTLSFERVKGTTVVSAGLFKGVDVRDFDKYVKTLGEYNEQIELVGGSLDHLDDKGKNLSDTFNTWQKELASITEGKNLKGEGIRLFDDESITQINKLTDATARVAEEYDKLAKEKKEVDKALKSEGAKADKDTYAKLQERLGKINEGMSGLYDFLKKYGALDLIKSDDKTKKSAEQALKEELAAVEKIYKRYQDLRKLKSESDTQSILAKEFKGVSLTTLSKAYSPKQMLAVYQKALVEAQRLGKKDVVLEIQTKIGEFNVAEEQRKLEKKLKDLSDRISRTKTAKEFFDRMLGLTGDKQLSATLTMSVYGTTGDDLQKLMTKQVTDAFKGVDITSAMLGGGKFDYNILDNLVKKLPESQQKNAQSIVDNWRKANADIITDLYKTYEEFLSFEERKTRVVEKENAERMRIINSGLPMAEQEKLVGASQKRENKALADIAIEEFKASADWAKSFEDLEHLATPTIERLMAKLKEFIDTQKDLTPEQLKTLTNEYKKLYDGLIARNPFRAMTDGIKEYVAATKDVKTAKERVETAQEELRIATERKAAAEQNFKTSQDVAMASREYASAIKEYNKASQNVADADKDLGDALDAQKTALNKTVQGFNAASSAISNFGSIITDITEILGIAEDSEVGAFIKDLVKWLGVMAGVLGTVAAIIAIIEAELTPLLAIAAGIAAIGAAISFLSNAKVRKANKEIERQQELLDQLAYSYERLEKAQEKAFGSDYISNYEQRLANLQAQQEAYLAQADAERSKGKKADSDKIKEYEEQARATADAIKDMQSELSEYFLGTDLTSAARDFANAWIDAYKEFGSTTDAMKEKFQDMIQNMVIESFAAKVIQTALQDVFDSIDGMTKDGVLDVSEASKIADMTEVAVGNIDVGMTNLMNALSQAGISVRGMGSELTGISRDIATASEESILGLAAGINTQNFYISQVPPKLDVIIGLLQGGNLAQGSAITLQDLVTIQNQHLSYLPSIAQHTAETVAECKQIVAETRRTADALERVIKPRGTQATHTLNATIN